MVTKKDWVIAALATFCLTVSLLTMIPTRTSSSAVEYDPWIDYNSDGVIDGNELWALGQQWGTSGDPTKNVNVMNWPVKNATNAWWNQYIGYGGSIVSNCCRPEGFGQLHILVKVDGLTMGESFCKVELIGALWNITHNEWWEVTCYTLEFYTNAPYESSYASLTVPVPSDLFYFRAYTDPNPMSPTDCYISLSFYLTWS